MSITKDTRDRTSWGAGHFDSPSQTLSATIVADPPKPTVLDEAKGIVYGGDRERDYGHPLKHFTRTVGMINSLFAHKLKEPLTAEDWPRMMICEKLARSIERYKRDNPRDTAGWAATWARVAEEGEP